MNIYYACVYGHLMGAGWGTFFWKFCWNTDLTSVSHPHSVHTAQRKWVSRMMSWLQQKCHPLIYSLTFNHSFFKMRRVCVCVCVCVCVPGTPWSIRVWYSDNNVLFSVLVSSSTGQIVKSTEYQHTVWEEPGWEKRRVLKQPSGAHPIQKEGHHPFIKKTLR